MPRTTLLLAVALAVAPGCCTIVSDTDFSVQFMVHPASATVTIVDGDERVVHDGAVPHRPITLQTATTPFQPARYRLEFKAEGHLSQLRVIEMDDNPWSWVGILFPVPLLGGMFVDPVTGASWQPRPADLVQVVRLEPEPQ